MLTKEQAEQCLAQDPANSKGKFLIREKNLAENKFVISACNNDTEYSHHLFSRDPTSHLFLVNNRALKKKCTSFEEVVTHLFQESDLTCGKLVTPVYPTGAGLLSSNWSSTPAPAAPVKFPSQISFTVSPSNRSSMSTSTEGQVKINPIFNENDEDESTSENTFSPPISVHHFSQQNLPSSPSRQTPDHTSSLKARTSNNITQNNVAEEKKATGLGKLRRTSSVLTHEVSSDSVMKPQTMVQQIPKGDVKSFLDAAVGGKKAWSGLKRFVPFSYGSPERALVKAVRLNNYSKVVRLLEAEPSLNVNYVDLLQQERNAFFSRAIRSLGTFTVTFDDRPQKRQ